MDTNIRPPRTQQPNKTQTITPHIGSARGEIRMWAYDRAAQSLAAPPRQARNLRKLQGGPPHGKVARLAVSAGGRVLWSCGRETLSLWSAFSGQHLGSIDHFGGGAAGEGALAAAAAAGAFGYGAPPAAFDPAAISARTGVDAAAVERARAAAFAPDEGEGEAAEDAAKEALKSVAKGVTKVRSGKGRLCGVLGMCVCSRATTQGDGDCWRCFFLDWRTCKQDDHN